ncbi:hypothetical protein [Aliiroseovarius sp. PrR006]|uniref:hypothetical protein n=1 Tax=Aliiroseovarius sp. PrR006 TaxID=2706883 RepID=UPI0013D05E96|nr:hypothetical protein [Aliiroseovarius sp. PrR006]NDW53265.1 hypothetical protein [Aliiroseovarius sp. PrR006]
MSSAFKSIAPKPLDGFEFPPEYIRLRRLGFSDLEPWYFLDEQQLSQTLAGLRQRYPDRKLIPFARRQDNDDTACWDQQDNNTVYIIHDFASVGYEERDTFDGLYSWLRAAVEDLIEFDS